jgi:NAD(P)-dependent dehydrogenase (short-subunit alcohol dehydrogenase family)
VLLILELSVSFRDYAARVSGGDYTLAVRIFPTLGVGKERLERLIAAREEEIIMASEIRLDNRVAIVTGAGAGLGRSHALLMAARGARVVVNDLGGRVDGSGASRSATDAVVAEIRAAGGEAVPNYNTVATPQGAQSILKTALDAYGTIDIVVNNAGIILYKRLLEHTPEDFAINLAVHLSGSYYLSTAAFPIMKEKRYGRFVFTSSSGGMRGSADGVAYGAAKAGVVGLANVMALAGRALWRLFQRDSPQRIHADDRARDRGAQSRKAKRRLHLAAGALPVLGTVPAQSRDVRGGRRHRGPHDPRVGARMARRLQGGVHRRGDSRASGRNYGHDQLFKSVDDPG